MGGEGGGGEGVGGEGGEGVGGQHKYQTVTARITMGMMKRRAVDTAILLSMTGSGQKENMYIGRYKRGNGCVVKGYWLAQLGRPK